MNQPVIDAMYDIVKQGAKCRDEGSFCIYPAGSVEHFLHSQGWLTRDLQIALCRADPAYRRSQGDNVPDDVISDYLAAPMQWLVDRVEGWAEDRNLIRGATSQAQMVKLTEEVGEVAAAVARGNREALKDGIGDVTVVLIILAAQNGLSLGECLAAAYGEIKDRKGRMIDGVFVRDE